VSRWRSASCSWGWSCWGRRPGGGRFGPFARCPQGGDPGGRAVALLAARKRAPALTALAVVGLSILSYSLDYTSRLIDAPTLAAFFTLGTTGDRMREVGVGGVTLVRRARPDVVLMDIGVPRLNGLEASRAIAADPALKGVRVITLTTYELDEYVSEALQAGVSGF
jgi:CheY-like chemotaxis protein